jgi:hypothetical protein
MEQGLGQQFDWKGEARVLVLGVVSVIKIVFEGSVF